MCEPVGPLAQEYIMKLRIFAGPKTGRPTGGFLMFVCTHARPYVSIWFTCVLLCQYTSNPQYFFFYRLQIPYKITIKGAD